MVKKNPNWNYEATVDRVEEILAEIEGGDLELVRDRCSILAAMRTVSCQASRAGRIITGKFRGCLNRGLGIGNTNGTIYL
jgi:hypothetical protein